VPIAADDVAATLADIAERPPHNGTVELAGPDTAGLDEFVRRVLDANKDPRQVIADVHAHLFGGEINDTSLLPGDEPRIGATHFADWLSRSVPGPRRASQTDTGGGHA
jgi:uncharacterized protein YbjT (DUF2867 family)